MVSVAFLSCPLALSVPGSTVHSNCIERSINMPSIQWFSSLRSWKFTGVETERTYEDIVELKLSMGSVRMQVLQLFFFDFRLHSHSVARAVVITIARREHSPWPPWILQVLQYVPLIFACFTRHQHTWFPCVSMCLIDFWILPSVTPWHTWLHDHTCFILCPGKAPAKWLERLLPRQAYLFGMKVTGERLKPLNHE